MHVRYLSQQTSLSSTFWSVHLKSNYFLLLTRYYSVLTVLVATRLDLFFLSSGRIPPPRLASHDGVRCRPLSVSLGAPQGERPRYVALAFWEVALISTRKAAAARPRKIDTRSDLNYAPKEKQESGGAAFGKLPRHIPEIIAPSVCTSSSSCCSSSSAHYVLL